LIRERQYHFLVKGGSNSEHNAEGRSCNAKKQILILIPDASSRSLHSFIRESIEPGSTIHTDGWEGYSGLDKIGYHHEITPLRNKSKSASELLPRVHRVISLLKRWLMGTHQGAISHEHLGYYLDEFVFRFNRRKSHYRGKLFYRLIEQAVQIDPATYHSIVRHVTGLNYGKHNR
jgi:transposase-like protein